MSGLISCLCTVGLIWIAMSVIGGIFGRRGRNMGGNGSNGVGDMLGGLGIGWMMANMMNNTQHHQQNQHDSNIIDGETWGTEQVDNATQIEDNGGGWDSGEDTEV